MGVSRLDEHCAHCRGSKAATAQNIPWPCRPDWASIVFLYLGANFAYYLVIPSRNWPDSQNARDDLHGILSAPDRSPRRGHGVGSVDVFSFGASMAIC